MEEREVDVCERNPVHCWCRRQRRTRRWWRCRPSWRAGRRPTGIPSGASACRNRRCSASQHTRVAYREWCALGTEGSDAAYRADGSVGARGWVWACRRGGGPSSRARSQGKVCVDSVDVTDVAVYGVWVRVRGGWNCRGVSGRGGRRFRGHLQEVWPTGGGCSGGNGGDGVGWEWE